MLSDVVVVKAGARVGAYYCMITQQVSSQFPLGNPKNFIRCGARLCDAPFSCGLRISVGDLDGLPTVGVGAGRGLPLSSRWRVG